MDANRFSKVDALTFQSFSNVFDRARHRLMPSGWTIATLAIACLVAMPVVVVLSRVLIPTNGVWEHLASTVLPYYLANTAQMVWASGRGPWCWEWESEPWWSA